MKTNQTITNHEPHEEIQQPEISGSSKRPVQQTKAYLRGYRDGIKETVEKMIDLSDHMELEHNTTLEEWKGFKHFRDEMMDYSQELKSISSK